MASSKAATAMFNDTTLTAEGANTTSSSVDLIDGFGASIGMKITNGTTGPTKPAEIQVEISQDDTEFYAFGEPLIGRTKASASASKTVVLPDSVMYARLVAGGNVGEDVVAQADLAEVTALA